MVEFIKNYFQTKQEKKKQNKSQILENLFKVPRKDRGVNMPHVNVPEPNIIQQADILYMPDDQGYKYILMVVDAFNSLTDAEPLKNRTTSAVKNAFQKIYSRGILKLPWRIELDAGAEFKGDVIDYFNQHNVSIRVAKVGRHRQQAIVEKRNQIVGRILFMRMQAQELLTKKASTEWVEYLPIVIESMNERVLKHPPKRPGDSDPVCEGDSCRVLEKGTNVRVQLEEPIDYVTGKKLHGKFRAMDIRWDPRPRFIREVLIKPGSPPLYLLDGHYGRKKIEPVAYTKNQLQIIDNEEEMPSYDLIATRKPNQYVVEKILEKKKMRGKWYYLIKWLNYPLSDATYELATQIRREVPDIVSEWQSTQKD